MKKVIAAGILVSFWFSISVFGIGLQHGLFRSQSTQGDQWLGTATIVSEHYNITVYPDYLDIELDWVFEVGGTEPDGFADALEIVGNLNLEDNSTVVSMLVWYKDMILKAKLKENKTARDEYEEVVERDSDAPPPPRDPVLLEMIRDDNYDISIFPVEFGGQRKVRIRYLIPGKTINGEIQIGYPHAFTDNASVSIKKGPGVAAYRLITSAVIEPIFYNDQFEALSRAEYSFKAYSGSSGASRITAIVPELIEPEPVTGSRMYMGTCTAGTFSGTMAHISTPTASEIMLKSSVKEDFVVVWRWNSADILTLYRRQIISQATLLKSFFSALNASSKRGALIISKSGGEMKKFQLDKNGGETFNELLEYLTELSNLDEDIAIQPTTKSITAEESKALAEQSFEEFKTALKAAVALVKDSDAKKYILILTAGPSSRTGYDTGVDTTGTKDITISLFSQFYASGGSTYPSWPGVALSRIIAPPTPQSSLKIYAYISNGTQVDSFQTNVTSYYGNVSAADRFVYSKAPLQEELTWKLYDNDELLVEFTEPLNLLPVTDTMQYARLVGSLKSMMPMAETMPTSLASTLGFIDMKYTLLALEEDALDAETAALYKKSGVPLLTDADIFPADDEKDAIPVDEWLKANPRETIQSSTTWGGGILFDDMRINLEEAAFDAKGGVVAPGGEQWGNPQAEIITVESVEQVAGVYDIAPVKQTQQNAAQTVISYSLQHGYLTIDFGTIQPSRAELVLYDMMGRVVMRWKYNQLLSDGILHVRLPLAGIPVGMYLVRLEKSNLSFSQPIMIK